MEINSFVLEEENEIAKQLKSRLYGSLPGSNKRSLPKSISRKHFNGRFLIFFLQLLTYHHDQKRLLLKVSLLSLFFLTLGALSNRDFSTTPRFPHLDLTFSEAKHEPSTFFKRKSTNNLIRFSYGCHQTQNTYFSFQ